jgi:hypothetical protein
VCFRISTWWLRDWASRSFPNTCARFCRAAWWRPLAWNPPATLSLLLVHRKDDALPALAVLRELLGVVRLRVDEKKS